MRSKMDDRISISTSSVSPPALRSRPSPSALQPASARRRVASRSRARSRPDPSAAGRMALLTDAAVTRATLLKAVAQAQSVVERRNTIPILANVLIEATAEGVSFRATDLDTEIVYRTTAQVEQPDVELLWKAIEEEPGRQITVDLTERTVVCGGLQVPFRIDEYTRWRLMEGLDDVSLTLSHEQEIEDFEARRASFKPRTLPVRT